MVDLDITTIISVPCNEFDITFPKKITTLIKNSEEISHFYTLLHNLKRDIKKEKISENKIVELETKIPFGRDTQSNTVEFKYTANNLINTRGQIIINNQDIICFNSHTVLWNQKVYEMSPELLTFINKHINIAKKKKSKKR